MICMMRRVAYLTAPVLGAVLIGTVTNATADAPPSSWENRRTLDCGGETVEAFFTPGGVFTAFNVVGSSDVIVPKHVEVIFPGETEPVTTLDVPGFRSSSRETVTCTYTDPAGLRILLTGVRSGQVSGG